MPKQFRFKKAECHALYIKKITVNFVFYLFITADRNGYKPQAA